MLSDLRLRGRSIFGSLNGPSATVDKCVPRHISSFSREDGYSHQDRPQNENYFEYSDVPAMRGRICPKLLSLLRQTLRFTPQRFSIGNSLSDNTRGEIRQEKLPLTASFDRLCHSRIARNQPDPSPYPNHKYDARASSQ